MRSLLGGLLNRSPVPHVNRWGGSTRGLPFAQGGSDERYMAAMGEVSTLFAIVNRITEAVSSVDWNLYRKSRSGEEDDRTIVTGHAALDLWHKPNPFYTRQSFVEWSSQHLTLTGKSPWVLHRLGDSPPLEMWVVRPDRLHPVKHPEKFQIGWVYKLGSEEVPLGLNEVIRQEMPRPLDPYDGMGPVEALGTDLDSTRFAAEWNRNFFLNSAQPGGIVEVDRRMSDDEFDEMRARWQEQHQGVSAAHRVAILEQAKWVDRKYSMRDMEFTKLRQDAREVIREAFGFPKAMLGSVDDINRANAEANEVVFARWLVVPRLERIKGALNTELLPMFGEAAARTLEFDYLSPVPNDVALNNATLVAKANAAVALIEAGGDPEEVLNVVGLPPIKWPGKPEPAAPSRDELDLAAALRNGHAHV